MKMQKYILFYICVLVLGFQLYASAINSESDLKECNDVTPKNCMKKQLEENKQKIQISQEVIDLKSALQLTKKDLMVTQQFIKEREATFVNLTKSVQEEKQKVERMRKLFATEVNNIVHQHKKEKKQLEEMIRELTLKLEDEKQKVTSFVKEVGGKVGSEE